MNKEELFQLVGVSYQIKDNSITFFSKQGDSKMYFPIDTEILDSQIEYCGNEFFMTFPYLQKELDDKLNGTQH